MIDAVIIGAGQCGLAASWHLSRRGIEHVVLERGRIAESWRSQRWDSFALNTPTWMNALPGAAPDDGPSDAFLARDAWIDRLQRYADDAAMPIRTSTTVVDVVPGRHPGSFLVTTSGDGADEPIETRQVVVATGAQIVPRIPGIAAQLPAWVRHLHTADYRDPASLEPGAVLVVGSAQSGVQIVEDLLDAGRTVYLCTSLVGRLRRRQRGRDSLEWLQTIGFYDMTPDRLPDPRLIHEPIPQTSGIGRHGHTVSLQSLAERGVRLLGRPMDVDGDRILLDDSLGANIAYGDTVSAEINGLIVRGIEAAGLALPPLEPDPADDPHPDPHAVHGPSDLDLDERGISTVIWTTGFTGDFGFLRDHATDDRGVPLHDRGASPTPGIHFLGLRWLTTRKSALILGAGSDAAAMADRIAAAG